MKPFSHRIFSLTKILTLTGALACASASFAANANGVTDTAPAITTQPGVETTLMGFASHPDQLITKYEWDFEGDGIIDYTSTASGVTKFTYSAEGEYKAIFKAYTENGELLPVSSTKVSVSSDIAAKTMSLQAASVEPTAIAAADGSEKHYAVIISYSQEQRFWDDIEYLYSSLLNQGYTADDIYLLNSDGTNLDGENPNGMIDYSAELENVQTVFTELASKIDEDDVVHVFVDGHGFGYTGPNQHSEKQQGIFGYNTGNINSNSEELDYLESEFVLRSVAQKGDYPKAISLNQWGPHIQNAYDKYYRIKYVSNFENVYFENTDETISDSDETIEMFYDYLLGDVNKDGKITGDEITDFDGDGIEPYNPETGEFDEDDWGNIDLVTEIASMPGVRAYGSIYNESCTWRKEEDTDLDNTMDLYCGTDGVNYTLIATDSDNNGYYDEGVDINMDGDFDDYVDIDEKVQLVVNDITDDELKTEIEKLGSAKVTLILESCYSGGFIDDISSDNHVIMSPTEEETVSYGNYFIRNTVAALAGVDIAGNAVEADTNGDGVVDFAETFIYAAANDYYLEVPQYDDNADGIGSAEIPNGTEGTLGSTITLQAQFTCDEFTDTNTNHESSGRAYSETVIEGQSCWGSYCWGGTEVTTWYAIGSDENLGTSGSTTTTLHEESQGVFATGVCPGPDLTAPIITLLGDNPMTIYQGSDFTDPGATAEDNIDGDITSSIAVAAPVDPDTIGTYEVVYEVSDAAGNTATATRTVEVIAEPACQEYTDTISNHESAGRAYSVTETTGQTCYGSWCWGGTTTTTWYAEGSDENLGTSSSATVTLRTSTEGYITGNCPTDPVAPVIVSYEVTSNNYTQAVITGVASDDDEDIDRVVLGLGAVTGIVCEGTTNFTCTLIWDDYGFEVGAEVSLSVSAWDSRNEGSNVEQFMLTRPEQQASVPPVISNIQQTREGTIEIVTLTVTDVDDDLDAVFLYRIDDIGVVECSNTGGDQYQCDMQLQGTSYATMTWKARALDLAENFTDSDEFTVKWEEPASCYTATNSEHISADRATLMYNILVYANGSNDYLGMSSDTTSLEETSDGVWTKVSNCE